MNILKIGSLSKEKQLNIRIALFVILSLLVVVYIFSNSLESAQESKSKSERVTKIVKSIVDPKDKIAQDVFHKYIRKVAHATEFMTLGVCLGGIFYNIYLKNRRKYISMPILFGMSIGLCDEFIQRFQKKRSSEVLDVLIDFSGVMIGLLAVLLLAFLINRKNKKKKEK